MKHPIPVLNKQLPFAKLKIAILFNDSSLPFAELKMAILLNDSVFRHRD